PTSLLFFLFMLRPLPTSTLFPYTTLFRSSFSRRPLQIAFLRVVEDSRCPRNVQCVRAGNVVVQFQSTSAEGGFGSFLAGLPGDADRKSTRLNSSHVSISYAVFCLKKKNST